MLYGVILAAGSGRRMNLKLKKQYISINNKPVFYYSVDKFLKIKSIGKIILVINESDKNNNYIKKFIAKYNKYIINNKICIITGGRERYDSVYSSLKYIESYYTIKSDDKIIIHDSARPNVEISDIKRLINKLNKYKAITLACKLSDTIKEISQSLTSIKKVVKTLDRTKYYLIQTPQGFNLKLLNECYNRFYLSKTKIKITDDLQLIERFSKTKTYVIDSSSLNLKITTQNDLNMIKYIM